MAELRLSLDALTKNADIELSTLRKVINQEPNFSPKFNFISNLAKFFKCSPIDLLVDQHLPYYIPVVNLQNVDNFIQESEDKHNKKYHMLKINGLFNYETFAVKSEYEMFGENYTVYFCCRPQTTIKANALHIIIINSIIMLARILSIQEHSVEYSLINNMTYSISLNAIKVLAVVSRLIPYQQEKATAQLERSNLQFLESI
jgi:hypothetical protein